MSFNMRDYVSNDHIESIGEIAKSQSAIIQALSLENSKLQKQLQQKENIIKEVRELINYYGITPEQNDDTTCRSILKQFLKILDKGE